MQGAAGCYLKNSRNNLYSAEKILDRMLSGLSNAALNNDRFDFTGFSLSILSLSKTPAEFKPLHFTSGGRHIFIDGFVKDRSSFLKNMSGNNGLPELISLVQYSGIYNIISFNETNNEFKIANDRHGAKYLYCYEDDDCFIFAPNPKIILLSGMVKHKEIDYQAVISLLSHEYIMGDRSLVKSIKLFPFATEITFLKTRKEINNYWNFDSLKCEKNSSSHENLLEEGRALLKSAIESYALPDENIIIPMSGGLDSRTIACFLSGKTNSKGIHINYGFEKKLAKRIAGKLKIDLEVFPFVNYKPWEAIDPFILCANQSIHQFWIYPFLKKKIQKNDGTLVVDGYLMNEVIGGLSTLNRRDYANINKRYIPLHKQYSFILGPKIKENYYTNHDNQVAEILCKCPSDNDYDRYLYFTVLNYGRRFTILFSVVHQYLCSMGLPILDYDLMEFCMKLPFEMKINSRFYREMVVSCFPQVSSIPWSRNRLPLNTQKTKPHFRINLERQINRYKYHLTRISKTKIETLPVHNKNRRFRKDKAYRDYFMDIVFNDRTFDKGYVSREGLNKLMQQIDGGLNYFDYLEKVAVIELVTRELDAD